MSDLNPKPKAGTNMSGNNEKIDNSDDDDLMLHLSDIFNKIDLKDTTKVEKTRESKKPKVLEVDVNLPKKSPDEFHNEKIPDSSSFKSERKTFSRGSESVKSSSFYGHDDRVYLEYEDETSSVAVSDIPVEKSFAKNGRSKKLWNYKPEVVDRWRHDLYVEEDQMPKTTQELIDTYGYDIRKEKSTPEVKRRTIVIHNSRKQHDVEQKIQNYPREQFIKTKRFSEQRNRSLPEWVKNK